MVGRKSRTFTRKILATAQPKALREISNLNRSINRQLATAFKRATKI